jgi:L-asparagine transporter-like permease
VESTDENMTRDLFVSGLITLSVAPGILALGVVLAFIAGKSIFTIMLGVSTLVGFVGLGMIAASYAVEWYENN